jgi:CRP/FNR family transcriptional regulator, cyclic AMP receptor protein
MITQTLPAQSRLGVLALPRTVVPLDLSRTLDNAVSKKRMMERPVGSMVARLARHPFLAGMKRRQLESLADYAMTVQFKKGQVIFHEGDLADRFYLIENGKVHLESSSGLPDPYLGYSWMFTPHIWTYTACAVEPITAIFFSGKILRELCENDHSFGYEFLKRMSFEMHQHRQGTRLRRHSSAGETVAA